MPTLKKCPFCNTTPTSETTGTYTSIRCPNCEVDTPLYSSQLAAVDAWNRRAVPTANDEREVPTAIKDALYALPIADALDFLHWLKTAPSPAVDLILYLNTLKIEHARSKIADDVREIANAPVQ